MLLALVTAMQAIGTIFTLPSIDTDLGSTPDRARLTLSLYLGGFA
ncbi:MAG: Bcr/CflA family drug resistance efflux transporter, partial [Betaproteobacteria bacterium]|nr:Bcr/CflA family drug resistance efflux transporter [Betaproteobacteria bacterium]